MLSASVVVVLVVVAGTYAKPNGAPGPDPTNPSLMMNTMCSSGNMRPLHRKNGELIMPQTGPAPFTLTVQNANLPYGPGSQLRVTLQGLNNKQFQGFVISGDGEDAKTGFQGTFSAAPGTAAKPSMFCTNGITHTSPAKKNSVTILWTPPSNFTLGTIQFKATVAETYEKFYTGVLSNIVRANAAVDTQSVYMQKKMQEMMASFRGGSGGAGGMGGGLNFAELMKNMQNMRQNGGGGGGMGFGGPLGGGGPSPFQFRG